MVIRYREINGQVVKDVINRGTLPRGEERPSGHFSQTLLKAYYAQECEHGSRFRSSYPKSVIKRAHERAIARNEASGSR